MVEANGVRDRFDQAVGTGWMVIGLGVDPDAALTDPQRSALLRLEGRTVNIGSAGTQCDVIDSEATYATWMAAIDAKYLILRPDFYVAATANSENDLRLRFDQVLEKLQLTPV